MKQTLTVNIDLDDIRYYRGIHALPDRPEQAEIFTSALPRFLDLCEEYGIKATLFVIACDLDLPQARAAIADAATRGHEIASHTVSHDYGVSLADDKTIDDELRMSKMRLSEVSGQDVCGFRGPGYNLSDRLLAGLVRAGYLYDTSIMSSPPYWMARAAIIMAMKVAGRKSASIIGRGRDFFRGDRPFAWQGAGAGLMEFPITASGPLRMPLIGTTLAGSGLAVRQMVAASARKDFVNIEFHGIDFLDRENDGLEPELLVEPALKIPLNLRMKNFRTHLDLLARDRDKPCLAALNRDSR